MIIRAASGVKFPPIIRLTQMTGIATALFMADDPKKKHPLIGLIVKA